MFAARSARTYKEDFVVLRRIARGFGGRPDDKDDDQHHLSTASPRFHIKKLLMLFLLLALSATEEKLCVRNHLQLIPFFIAILRHQLMRGAAELLRLVRHLLGVVLQSIELVAALHHQHVRPADLVVGGGRARSQLLDVGIRSGD